MKLIKIKDKKTNNILKVNLLYFFSCFFRLLGVYILCLIGCLMFILVDYRVRF